MPPVIFYAVVLTQRYWLMDFSAESTEAVKFSFLKMLLLLVTSVLYVAECSYNQKLSNNREFFFGDRIV